MYDRVVSRVINLIRDEPENWRMTTDSYHSSAYSFEHKDKKIKLLKPSYSDGLKFVRPANFEPTLFDRFRLWLVIRIWKTQMIQRELEAEIDQ